MADHSEVYSELRQILLPYARKLDCRTDDGVMLDVDTRHVQKNRKRLFFAAVRMGKADVSCLPQVCALLGACRT